MVKFFRTSTIIAIVGFILVVGFLSVTLGQSILEGRNPDIGSFVMVHFAGYLFFLVMPVEALVPWYASQGHSVVMLWLLAVVTAIIAQMIDFGIGFAAPHDSIEKYIGKKKYQRMKMAIEKYGNVTVLLFNLLPISSPILLLVAGMTRCRFRQVLFFSFVGLTIKYWFIITVFAGT